MITRNDILRAFLISLVIGFAAGLIIGIKVYFK